MARKWDNLRKLICFSILYKKEGNAKLAHLRNNFMKNTHLVLVIAPNIYSTEALVLDMFILMIMFIYISRCSMTGCFSQWLQLHQIPVTRIFSLQHLQPYIACCSYITEVNGNFANDSKRCRRTSSIKICINVPPLFPVLSNFRQIPAELSVNSSLNYSFWGFVEPN